MPKPPAPTRFLAERHEALFVRLETLTRQIGAIAARRPTAPVPEATRIIAEALLCDVRPFAGQGRGLPVAAADMAGLATQLGQALAALADYESAYSRFSAELACFAWIVRGDPVPVRRLRPASVRLRTAKDERESRSRRQRIMRRFEEKGAEGYRQGYADAIGGQPNREETP